MINKKQLNLLAKKLLTGFIVFLSFYLIVSWDYGKVKWRKFDTNIKSEQVKINTYKAVKVKSNKIDEVLRPTRSLYTNLKTVRKRLKPLSSNFLENITIETRELLKGERLKFPGFYFKDNTTENIKYIDKAHGFFSNLIVSVVEDDNGYLWVASEHNGLIKTNGTYFWHFKKKQGLKSNSITKLFKDSKNRIWICWDKGLAYLKDGKISFVKNRKLDDTRVRRIREDKQNRIWIATEKHGLFMFNEQKRQVEVYDKRRGLPTNDIDDIVFEGKNIRYIASQMGGLSIIEKDSILTISDKDKGVFEFSPIALHKSKNKLWIGSFSGCYFYLKNNEFYKVKFSDGYERCFDIEENKFGIWFANYSSGMILLQKDGNVHLYSTNSGLVGRNAYDFSFDHNNNVWVADPFNGLSLIIPSPFSEKHDFGQAITSFCKGLENDLWIAHNGMKVNHVEKNENTYFDIKPEKGLFSINHSWDLLADEKGSIWHSTHGNGIARYFNEKYTVFEFKSGNFISDLTNDKKDIWFSTIDEGIRKFNHATNSFQIFSTKNGLLSNAVKTSRIDKSGRIWICTDKGINIIYKNKIGQLTAKDGLSSNDVNNVSFDRFSNVWVATEDAGITLLMQNNLVKKFDTQNGLIFDRVLNVFHDSKGRSWAITTSGLSCFEYIKAKHDFEITNYGIDYGSFMLDFTGAVIESRNGKINFGCSKGYVEFDPYFLQDHPSSAIYNLEAILIDGVSVSNLNKPIEVLTNQEVLIDASFINWGNSKKDKVSYALQMVGEKDTTWINVRQNELLELQNLSNGKYVLYFKVNSDDKVEVAKGPVFVLRAPWYASIWFYVLCLILLALIVMLFVKYRLQYLKEKQNELEKIVKERTDELESEKIELSKAFFEIENSNKEKDILIYEMHHRVKNNLQTISTLLDLQMRTIKNRDGVSAIKDAVRRITAMSSSHELLYSSEDLLKINFKTFLKNIISSQEVLLISSDSKLAIHYFIDDFQVDFSNYISIGMIVSEAISNSVKHAFEGVEYPEIKIVATHENGNCILSIIDNGNGFIDEEIKQLKKGIGLKLMHIFTKKINGNLEIIHPETGVEVKIVFPCMNQFKEI